MQAENAKARREDDAQLKEAQAKIAEIGLKVSRLVQAIAGGVNASAMQGAINDFDRELTALKIRQGELEKQRERALRIPTVTDAAVDDVLGKLRTVLDATIQKN